MIPGGRIGTATRIVAVASLGLAAWVIAGRFHAAWPLDVHLRDDAYYYFAWARSLSAGEGPCITPGVPTSGVHILWPLLLTPVVWITGAEALPSVSVFLGLGLHLATALLLLRVGAADRWTGCTAAALYAGSPYLAGEAIHGQTGVACLALLAFLAFHHRSPRAFLALALVAVAARSDLICFVVAAALSEPRLRVRRLLAVLLVLACYALGNLLLAGHWLQDSARPIPWLLAAELEHGGGDRWARLWRDAQPLLTGLRFRLTSTALALGWLVMAWLGATGRGGSGDRRFGWWLLGGLALVALHDLWRGYPRDYYFAPLAVVGALALIRLSQLRPRLGLLVAVLGLLWNGRHLGDPPRVHPAQREMAMAGRLVSRFLPAGEKLGCFNAGLVTWYHDGPVINLDGVVNRPAFAALRRGELLAYLREQDVHYLVDNPIQFASRGVHANGRHFGGGFVAGNDLVECIRFHWPAAGTVREREGIGWFSLYRLRGGGRPWRAPTSLCDLGPVPGGRAIGFVAREGQRLQSGADPPWPGFTAPADLCYVIQVPWDGTGELVVTAEGAAVPRLVIAPR